MRILVISNLLPPRMLGGFELAALTISRALRERGHEVLILTSPAERYDDSQAGWVDRSLNLRELFVNVQPHHEEAREAERFASRVSNIQNTLIVLDRLRSFQPDHVMTFGLVGLGGLAILDAIRSAGIPITMNLGDDVPIQLVDGWEPEVLAHYEAPSPLFSSLRYAIISRTLQEEVAARIELGPTQIIPRGAAHPDLVRTRPHRADGETRFVSSGIVSPHKGIDITVQAVALLKERGLDRFRVDVYGGGLHEEYRARTRELGLGDVIEFHGPTDQQAVLAAEAASDALVFPTWHREPFGNAPIEAAAAGCVPIITEDFGAAEWLVDGVHAIKIQRNPESLADAMERVIRGEVDLEAMAKAGRELAHGSLSFERTIIRLESWLLEGSSGSRFAPDWPALAARALRKDDDVRWAHDAVEKEIEEVAVRTAQIQAQMTQQSWYRRLLALPLKAMRWVVRPFVEAETRELAMQLAARERAVSDAEDRLIARERAAQERDEALRHLIQGVRKDIMATNHRIDEIGKR